MKFYNWNNTGPAREGIYILLVKKQINKIYQKDSKGILYIGGSKNLKRRLNIGRNYKWSKYYRKKENSLMFNHSTLTFTVDVGEDLILRPHKKSINGGILKTTDKLFLKYAVTKKYKTLEEQLLRAHVMLFGQLPPFNNKGLSLKYIWNEFDQDDWKSAKSIYKETIKKL